MGKPSRAKGLRIEREIVQRHKDMGVRAERVPLSGAAGGSFTGDIIVVPEQERFRSDRHPLIAEVKSRKNGAGFATLEGWLASNDVLFLRRDRAEPLVVLPWSTWERLVSLMRERRHELDAQPRQDPQADVCGG